VDKCDRQDKTRFPLDILCGKSLMQRITRNWVRITARSEISWNQKCVSNVHSV